VRSTRTMLAGIEVNRVMPMESRYSEHDLAAPETANYRKLHHNEG
jgi:hypothetical protein